jgi:hypothetical protein
MLTAAECYARAVRKLAEAKSDPQHGRRLRNAAAAWYSLANQMKAAERGQRRAASLLRRK